MNGGQEADGSQQEAGAGQQEVGVGPQEAVVSGGSAIKDLDMDPEPANRTDKLELGRMTTKSGGEVKKSRIILEEEDYKRGIAYANGLTKARRKLKLDWRDFEAAHPPSCSRLTKY